MTCQLNPLRHADPGLCYRWFGLMRMGFEDPMQAVSQLFERYQNVGGKLRYLIQMHYAFVYLFSAVMVDTL